jgi:ribosomal-protein-serine acetyltransferase
MMRVSEKLKVNPELSLMTLEPEDAPRLYQIIDENREHLRNWLPWVDKTESPVQVEEFIQRTKTQLDSGRGTQYVMSLSGIFVGCIGYHDIDWSNSKTSLGYWISRTHQGKGLARAACKRLVDYALVELELNRLEIRCGVGNHRSAAIPLALGFHEEGIARQAELLASGFNDLRVFSMLREDWQRSRP